jgi:hypothetical protein
MYKNVTANAPMTKPNKNDAIPAVITRTPPTKNDDISLGHRILLSFSKSLLFASTTRGSRLHLQSIRFEGLCRNRQTTLRQSSTELAVDILLRRHRTSIHAAQQYSLLILLALRTSN